MLGFRRSIRFVAGWFAIVLLADQAAAQQPNGTPSLPPPVAPTPQLAQPPVLPPGPGQFPQPAPVQPSFNPGLPGTPVFAPPPVRFNFKIDPKTPTKDLLPPAPKTKPITGPVLTDDLLKVPEVEFQAAAEKLPTDNKLVRDAAHQLAKIKHMNAKQSDAFMAALLENRPDLAGLPFIMGDDCRTTGARVQHFTQAATTVRQALGNATVSTPLPVTSFRVNSGGTLQSVTTPAAAFQTNSNLVLAGFVPAQAANQSFWQRYAELCEQEDAARTRPDKETTELVALARLAALTQMLAAESAEIRLGLVKYLTGVPHVEATKALARMAIFSPEDDIRAAAITALKVRREKDYTDILVKGLRYPWPAVAKRSADAIARLERADLIPDLVAILETDDPRMPTTKPVNGKAVPVVREVVKLNHHRNCMMCHAPDGSGTPNPNAISAEVAVQGQPLPTPAEGYRQSTQELMIRIDVTYLRADFSASLPVKDAHPWPEMQRFDFFIRERLMTTDETAAYREKLTPKEAGVLSPYHKAALAALRDMTGKDTAPTAEAWRKVLGMSPKSTTRE